VLERANAPGMEMNTDTPAMNTEKLITPLIVLSTRPTVLLLTLAGTMANATARERVQGTIGAPVTATALPTRPRDARSTRPLENVRLALTPAMTTAIAKAREHVPAGIGASVTRSVQGATWLTSRQEVLDMATQDLASDKNADFEGRILIKQN